MHLTRTSLRATLATSALAASLLALPSGARAQDADALLGSVAALVSLAPEASASSLDGSTRERALSLELDGSYEAILSAGASVWFAVDLPRDDSYGFDTEGSDCDTVLELYDAAGTRITVDDDGGSGVTSRIQHELATGRVFLRVHGFSDSTSGSIVCSAEASSADGGSEHTHELHAGYTLRTELEPSSTLIARFQAATHGVYLFSTSGSDFDTVLSLHSEDGRQQLAQNDDGGEGVTSLIQHTLEAGTYQLHARGFSDSAGGALVLAAELVGAPSQPAELVVGGVARTQLDAGDRLRFSLNIQQAGAYAIHTQGSDFDTVLELRDADDAVLASNDDADGGTTSRISLTLEPGDYTIVARGFGDESAGSLQLAVEPTAADSASQPDASAGAGDATPLVVGEQLVVSMGAGEEFLGSFRMEQSATVVLSTDGSDYDTVLHLLDGAGDELARDDDGGTGTASRILRQLDPGDYGVRVRAFSQTAGMLFLQLDVEATSGATQLPVDGELTRLLGAGQTLEFAFSAPSAGVYRFSTEGSDFDTVLTLRDAAGDELASNDDDGENTTSLIEHRLSPGAYVVAARGFGNTSAGRLQLSSSVEHSVRPDAQDGDGLARESAFALRGGQHMHGELGRDESRWFRLTLDGPQSMVFSTNGSDLDTVLRFCDAHGNEVASDDDGGEGTASLLTQLVPAGVSYVELAGFGGSPGSWALSAETRFDGGQMTLRPGTALEAELFQGEELEFLLESAGGRYVIDTDGSNFDTFLELYDSTGALLASNDDGGTGLSSRIEQDLAPGGYTVLVRAFGDGGGQLVLNASGATAAGAGDDDTLRLGDRVSGELAPDAEQAYDLILAAATDLVLSTEGSDFDTVLHLQDSAGNELASDDDGGTGTTSLIRWRSSAGSYRVRLRGFGSNGGTYVLSVAGPSATGPSATDPGADSATSGGLMLDQPHSSRLDANGEVGMPFHAPRPGRYVFSTEGSDFDTVLTLLDNRGNTLASDDDGGAGVTSRIEQVLAPGEYRIVASGFGGGSGQLQLSVTNAAGSSNDADPVPVELIDRSLPAAPARASHDGSTRSRAIQMSGDHRESGSLQGGAELWFSVQVQTPAIWEFSTGGSDFDTVLALYDPADEQVARDDDGGGGTSSLLRHSLTPGLWRVQLSGFSQSSGSYQLAGEAFSGLGIEALTLGQPHAAELSAGQELEFELNVTNEAEYSISTEGSDFDTVLSLHDVLGAQLASDDDGGNGTTSLITQQLEAGSYLVRVRGFSSAAAGSLILVASAEPVRLQPRRLRAAQGIEPDPAPSDGAGTGSGAADYDAVQLENAQLNLRVVELEVESQTRAAAAELQAARFVVEESRRALASFVEHEAPLEVARQELAIDRARAGVELASAELESIQAKMAESDNDLAELNAHLRARQQDVEFARRELELAETSMDVLAEIGIARRQRKLEQGVAEASAELEAAERALEVAELLGQLAINEARQWAEALHSMPAELPDGGHFQYEIF